MPVCQQGKADGIGDGGGFSVDSGSGGVTLATNRSATSTSKKIKQKGG
jgi:hypothetical protein